MSGHGTLALSSSSSSNLLQFLIQVSEPLRESISATSYAPPPAHANVSVKSLLLSLLPDPSVPDQQLQTKIKDFALCCAALASSSSSPNFPSQHLSWVPESLSDCAVSAWKDFTTAYYDDAMRSKCSTQVLGELELDLREVSDCEKKLAIELMPEVLPLLKSSIKESAIGPDEESGAVSAASARVPVAYAILAAYQFRWFVTQVGAPQLGKLCPLVIPCALTALDHWSPEVKGQGMISFICLGKNVSAAEIGGYADAILDACCQNIACDDEIWQYVVEMSVLLVTLTQQCNPRSPWYEKILNEMLNHLERQPRNKQRRIAWLTHCDLLFNGLGLVLLAHFRRLFPLFFKWIHADDDQTVLLVLKRMTTVARLTWIRNSPFIERLVDELVVLYKDSALKIACEDIRSLILPLLNTIRVSKQSQFDATWAKYKDDPNLTALSQPLARRDLEMVG
ncbi:uncharacterized protein At2g39910 [Andrographis paniculata]|uniref:uncharacterized protein At2g39910 n=1 Tax=Andrographis paniculata TaxID=175694 RepID=UPI0021E8BE39|nr:uncharacterized protein At2g39910 [Andrographis paniculata]